MSEEWKFVIVITADVLLTSLCVNQRSETQNGHSELRKMR